VPSNGHKPAPARSTNLDDSLEMLEWNTEISSQLIYLNRHFCFKAANSLILRDIIFNFFKQNLQMQ
jgi:hypothetical protein